MIRVSTAEHELLTLTRAIIGLGQYTPVEDLLRDRHTPVPERLSPGAMNALRDTLSKGAVLTLARCGGWRRQRYLDGGQERSGRLWERHPPPALVQRSRRLAFSQAHQATVAARRPQQADAQRCAQPRCQRQTQLRESRQAGDAQHAGGSVAVVFKPRFVFADVAPGSPAMVTSSPSEQMR